MVTGLTGGEFPMEWAIAGMTVMFVLYGMAGGLGAAVITDFIQGVLTIIFSFLLLPFALYYAAQVAGTSTGFQALRHGVPGFSGEEMLTLTLTKELAIRIGAEPITWFYVLMLSVNALIGIVVQPHIMGVCGAGRTEMEGRFGFTAGNFLKRLCTIAWTFTGLACVIIYLTPENGFLSADRLAELKGDSGEMKAFADSVFGYAAHDILPTILPGLVGLLFASLLATIMSTCDAQMVVASGLFTENIYRKWYAAGSERHYLWVGRIASLVIVGLALALMSQFQDAIQVLNRYVNAIPAFIGLAFWFGIVWRKFSPAAVWASTITAALLWYLTTSHTPFTWVQSLGEHALLQENINYLPTRFQEWLWAVFPFTKYEVVREGRVVIAATTSVPWQYVIYLGGAAVVGIIVSLLTRPTSQEKLDHFFLLIRTPIRKGEEVSEPCTLPENPLPPDTVRLLPFKDIEIPRPSVVGMAGFLISWVIVFLMIGLTWWLAQLGQ